MIFQNDLVEDLIIGGVITDGTYTNLIYSYRNASDCMLIV